MKKIVFVFMVVLLGLGINDANAQFKVGGGVVYNMKHERMGINFRGSFTMSEKVDIVTKVDWLFPEIINGNKINVGNVAGDFHYHFRDRDAPLRLYLYPGIHILRYTPTSGPGNYGNGFLGINLGTGFELSITEAIDVFGEGKYSFIFQSDYGGKLVFSIGALYAL